MRKMKTKVALPCKISAGGFSDEITFKISVSDGEYLGTASKRYFWRENDEPIGELEVGTWTKGKMAARVLQKEDDRHVLVSIPDGEVVSVDQARLLERPSELEEHVPLRP